MLISCVFKDDWNSFSRFLALGLGAENEYPESYLDFLENEIQDYLDANNKKTAHDITGEDIKKPLITKSNVEKFKMSLKDLCEICEETELFDEIEALADQFFEKDAEERTEEII